MSENSGLDEFVFEAKIFLKFVVSIFTFLSGPASIIEINNFFRPAAVATSNNVVTQHDSMLRTVWTWTISLP